MNFVIVINSFYRYASVTKTNEKRERLTDQGNEGIIYIRLLADQAANYFALTSSEWVKIGRKDLQEKTPPYERLAHDLQYKIDLLRLIEEEIQSIHGLHANFEVKMNLWLNDFLSILGKLNANSHWSNKEVWRRCVHNHGYEHELLQPLRRNTPGVKIVTRVFTSPATDR